MDGRRIRRSVRRLLALFAVASAVSLLSSSPALAQSIEALTGVTSTSDAEPASPVQAAVAVVQQAAPAVEQATAPVAQTAAPLQQATAPAAEAVAPVVQRATPVVEQATAPVNDAAAPVVSQIAEPVARAIAPVVQAATPAIPVHEIVGPLATLVAEGRVSAGGQPKTPASPTHVVPTRHGRATVARRGPDTRPSAGVSEAPVVTPELPSNPRVTVAPNRGTSATAPRKPRPGLPGSPAGPGSSAAPIPGGGAPSFVAALAAALLLAAPGLSRRLRLNLAPWPLPIALPSLERPG